MAAAKRIPGVDRLRFNGVEYEWNDVTNGYWSVRGEPRMLQADDLPVSPVPPVAASSSTQAQV